MKCLYHHCLDLKWVHYGEITPKRRFSDPMFRPAYEWLETEVNFYPLFLSVGQNKHAHWMTGYHNNWRVYIGSKNPRKVDGKWEFDPIYRRKGEFPNMVMFSFDHVEGVFTDYQAWHFALSAYCNKIAGKPPSNLTEWERKQIFKASWTRARWLRHAGSKRGKGDVQLVAPVLDLRTQTRAWVRNQKTKQILEDMGFKNVIVKRIIISD